MGLGIVKGAADILPVILFGQKSSRPPRRAHPLNRLHGHIN
jgi:hypothetical protein